MERELTGKGFTEEHGGGVSARTTRQTQADTFKPGGTHGEATSNALWAPIDTAETAFIPVGTPNSHLENFILDLGRYFLGLLYEALPAFPGV